ncbi:hypothetical protein D3C85_1594590 [compost metagenome]
MPYTLETARSAAVIGLSVIYREILSAPLIVSTVYAVRIKPLNVSYCGVSLVDAKGRLLPSGPELFLTSS